MDKINHNLSIIIKFGCLLVAVLFFIFPASAQAARVFFEPTESTHAVGDTFSVDVRIDTEGETINALDLGIIYPPLVNVAGINKTGSAIQLWVFEPNFTSTGIFLTGGNPSGISGSNKIIARLSLQAKAIGDGIFQLSPNSTVLLNDGQGTQAKLRISNPAIHIVPKQVSIKPSTPIPSNSLVVSPSPSVSNMPQDKTRPESFTIFVGRDPNIFGGQYFASFFTTDAESGVDHYEIQENGGPFKIAQNPYLLSDQTLKSVVRVRAYDNAGNFRESTYPSLLKRFWLWILHILAFFVK